MGKLSHLRWNSSIVNDLLGDFKHSEAFWVEDTLYNLLV